MWWETHNIILLLLPWLCHHRWHWACSVFWSLEQVAVMSGQQHPFQYPMMVSQECVGFNTCAKPGAEFENGFFTQSKMPLSFFLITGTKKVGRATSLRRAPKWSAVWVHCAAVSLARGRRKRWEGSPIWGFGSPYMWGYYKRIGGAGLLGKIIPLCSSKCEWLSVYFCMLLRAWSCGIFSLSFLG